MRKIIASVAALALTLALVGPAFADTTGTVQESATVNSTLSLVLSVSSIDYGAINPGDGSGRFPVTATVVSNDPAGWTLVWSGTPFAAGLTRYIKADGLDDAPAPGAPITLTTTSGPGGGTFDTSFSVTAAASALAGTYTATMTYTVTAN